mmetsp:Transcript_31192/g.71202  ORF Transcript_31192/g.71202 Transcript_31192/m.71202 type:complete len:175 (-) Transcript_31192:34-558(-)
MSLLMRCRSLFLLLAVAKSLSETGEFGELTDNNFEHDTQAASGATTGDWLVLFSHSSPTQCASCTDVLKSWEGVRSGLLGRKEEGLTPYVNAAHVHLQSSPMLKRRFKPFLGSLPAVLLFRQANMYELRAAETKSIEEIVDFATTYHADALAHKVPPEPGIMDAVFSFLRGDEL